MLRKAISKKIDELQHFSGHLLKNVVKKKK